MAGGIEFGAFNSKKVQYAGVIMYNLEKWCCC